MLWVAMLATAIMIAIHLTLLYYLGRRYGNQEAGDITFYTFSDSLMLVLGIFCQQGKTHVSVVSTAGDPSE
jgi:membrane protein DedA with SNARE-associated domain